MEIVQEHLPALSISKDETRIKYSPIAVHASIEALPDMKNMKFCGKSPYELYVDEIRDIVGKIA